MNYIHEYAQLVAVAMPGLAIVGMNVYPWLSGERGTLLVPSLAGLPSVMAAREEAPMPAPFMTAAQQALAPPVAANDVQERKAA